MIYQLKSGRTIEMSVEQYLSMSDAELEYLNTYSAGDSVDDPWFGSVLSKLPPADLELDLDEIEDESFIEDLTDISIGEKFIDPDIDYSIEEE